MIRLNGKGPEAALRYGAGSSRVMVGLPALRMGDPFILPLNGSVYPRFHKDLWNIIHHGSRMDGCQGGVNQPRMRLCRNRLAAQIGCVSKSEFFFEVGFLLVELLLFGFVLLGERLLHAFARLL